MTARIARFTPRVEAGLKSVAWLNWQLIDDCVRIIIKEDESSICPVCALGNVVRGKRDFSTEADLAMKGRWTQAEISSVVEAADDLDNPLSLRLRKLLGMNA